MKGSSPNASTIVLAGLMLMALVTVAVIANSKRGDDSASESEEMVFKPEVVEVEEGSATLKLAYDASPLGFKAQGTEDIPLSITYNLDNIEEFTVHGYLGSTQRVDMGAMDQGNECWYNIQHSVEYIVSGTFNSATCTFILYVGMTPTSSQMLSTDCSFDPGLPLNQFYMAPKYDPLIFTSAVPNPSSSSPEYSFSLMEVALPDEVNCPAFVP